MPFSHSPTTLILPKHQDQVVISNSRAGFLKHFILPAALLHLLEPSAAEEQCHLSLFQTVCTANLHPEEEQWKPLTECFWCWLSSPSQVALDAFYFIPTQ